MNLYYSNEKQSDKLKILIRNICCFFPVYIILLGERFNIDDRIVHLFMEAYLVCLLVNFLVKYLREESLLDKLLKNKIGNAGVPDIKPTIIPDDRERGHNLHV
jgi:hypothetical protein